MGWGYSGLYATAAKLETTVLDGADSSSVAIEATRATDGPAVGPVRRALV